MKWFVVLLTGILVINLVFWVSLAFATNSASANPAQLNIAQKVVIMFETVIAFVLGYLVASRRVSIDRLGNFRVPKKRIWPLNFMLVIIIFFVPSLLNVIKDPLIQFNPQWGKISFFNCLGSYVVGMVVYCVVFLGSKYKEE